MNQSTRSDAVELHTTLSDEAFDDLSELLGQRVVSVSVWEDSLSDAIHETETAPEHQSLFDFDLYLDGGVYFELYGVACYSDPESEPARGLPHIQQMLLSLVREGVWLDDMATDEEEQLVLVLSQHYRPVLYLVVGGWLVDEWDELPDH